MFHSYKKCEKVIKLYIEILKNYMEILKKIISKILRKILDNLNVNTFKRNKRARKIAEMNISDPVECSTIIRKISIIICAAFKRTYIPSEKWTMLCNLHPLYQGAVVRSSILRLQVLDRPVHVLSQISLWY